MAADNVLEREVITANGPHHITSPTQNPDLFWVLNGGGGGSYAVVLSTTSKIHPDGPASGASLSFDTSNITVDDFWAGIAAYHVNLEAIVDTGIVILTELTNSTFALYSVNASHKTTDEVIEILQPFIANLTALAIPFTFSTTYFDNWYDHYAHYYGPLP